MKKQKTYINRPDKLIIHGYEVSVDLSPEIPFEPSSVNDAQLNDEAYNSGVRFIKPIITEDGYAVSELIMTIPTGLKMGEVFDRVPYGIINKTITGLGATTLEIMTPKRNSIVVVPTKTLAYSKVKKANEVNDSNYAMYIGSPIGDIKSNITINNVRNYLDRKKDDEVRKFVVVADSLPMLLNYLYQLDIDAYSDYFLMVDEIDTLQSDSSYRPRLEIVIDHYFKFDFNNRAVVSATMIPFSNPKFSKESSLRIEWNKQPVRKVNIMYSNYVEDAAINEINNLLQTTKDKILIAYNSLDGIFNIIDQLDVSKEDCGILCSDRSSEKVSDYKDSSEKAIDENGNLLHRVTFMTCAYFAGIDILDKCHLISISSKTTAYTYLSISKITQIAGRCRNGNLSETVLFDIPQKEEHHICKTKNEYKQILLDKATKYIKFLNAAKELVASDKDLLPMEHFICSFMDYISKSKPTRYDYPLTIIRQESINNHFVPAYFNIDALVEKWELRHSLYSSEFAFENALKENGQDVMVLPPFIQKEEEHIVPDKTEKKEATRLKRLSTIEKLKHDLIEWENNLGNEYALNEISSKVEKRMQETIVYGFKVLHLYYPSDELLDKLIEGYFSGKGFKNIFNAAVFYALPLDETFKAKVLLKFGCDNSTGKSECFITPQQRINLIGECFVETFKVQPKTEQRNLSELATSFFSFKTKKGKYCPTGYNPCNIPEPINTIPLGILTPSLFILPRKEDEL